MIENIAYVDLMSTDGLYSEVDEFREHFSQLFPIQNRISVDWNHEVLILRMDSQDVVKVPNFQTFQ